MFSIYHGQWLFSSIPIKHVDRSDFFSKRGRVHRSLRAVCFLNSSWNEKVDLDHYAQGSVRKQKPLWKTVAHAADYFPTVGLTNVNYKGGHSGTLFHRNLLYKSPSHTVGIAFHDGKTLGFHNLPFSADSTA